MASVDSLIVGFPPCSPEALGTLGPLILVELDCLVFFEQHTGSGDE